MRKRALFAGIGLILIASCSMKLPNTKQVTSKELSLYKTLQESQVCVNTECLSISILKGPDGNDYLKVNYESRYYTQLGFTFCNLTAFKQEVDKSNKGECTAIDSNKAFRRYRDVWLRLSHNMGIGYMKIPTIDFMYSDEMTQGLIKVGIRLTSKEDHTLPIYFGFGKIGFGLHYKDGKVRPYATIKESRESSSNYIYGNSWIDLKPYLLKEVLEKLQQQ